MRKNKLQIPHINFCIIYTIFIYGISNLINFDKFTKWFYLKDKIDYFGISAFFAIGFFLLLTFFLLIFHKKTIKPLAIIFIILSGVGTYFINKYNIAIDRSMIMNAINTDNNEVHSLLSIHMLPYVLFLIILPISIILTTKIIFKEKYFYSSLKICTFLLLISICLIYARFDSISRAVNLSRKYIIHSLIPLNYIQSAGSITQHSLSPYFSRNKQPVEISGKIAVRKNLIVVLAIGETSRQKNFSLYGYNQHQTNPLLSKDKKLHLLNGKARIGSTLYALPQILTKDGVPLPTLTHKSGVETACYVNYTLYDNCKTPGEVSVKNCGHNGTCYDEDVLPLLANNLKSYKEGERLIVLHLGGGSHGPSYHERYPQEFQKFKPICKDADVVNHCSIEELYNSYDNTIIYVDYVLSKIIEQLDKSKLPYVFIYISDHGESLMEDGHIFHGMPPGITLPKEQSQIPLIVKSSIPITIEKRDEYEQQDIFDTILNLFSIETKIGEKNRGFIKEQK